MPVGFPRSQSGADMRILKYLSTPEEANLVLYLSALPESIERIYKPPKDFNALLQKIMKIMIKKRGFLGSMKMMDKMLLKKQI